MLENKAQLKLAKFPNNATCAVTTSWDDNDNADIEIMNILDSMGLKGTFYIDPGNPKAWWAMGDGLTDSQLQNLAETHEVGSHTWSHIDMKRTAPDTLREELTNSKNYLENITGHTVLGIAYPWGKHSAIAESIARECGYIFARTIDEGYIDFPPLNPYTFGIGVQALSRQRPRILSRRGHIYAMNFTRDWRKLAVRFFDKAYRTQGVWHIFGHASEILQQPGLKDEFIETCRNVSNRDDVWYTTNGMLFIVEMMKRSVHIAESHHDRQCVFHVQANFPPEAMARGLPLSFRLEAPSNWCDKFIVNISTRTPEKFHVKRVMQEVWIDIFDNVATIEIEHE